MTTDIDPVTARVLREEHPTTAAERVIIGRHKLAEMRAQLEQARAAEGIIAGQAVALDTAVAAREKALDQAQAALEQAEQALLAARAAEMLSVYQEPEEKRAKEAALTRCAHALEEAKEAAAAAERIRESEAPLLEAKRREAAAKAGELEKLASAVRQAVAEAHADAGQDVLAELRGRHDELLAARAEALASFKAATHALHDFYDIERPTALAGWPDLAARTLEEQVGHPLTAAREVIEGWLLWIDALDVRHGSGDALPRFNTVDIIRLLAYMQEDDITGLLYALKGHRPKEAFLMDLRQSAVKVLERLG